jgi:AcrR family transcriptional regulator
MPRAGLDSEAVVAAAAKLADADGLGQLTLARLAQQLGVRAPSLYAHVGGGLPDLRGRLATRGARELAAALQSAAAGRSRLDALRAVAHAYRAYAQAHPGTYAAMQRAPETDDPDAGLAARELVGVIVAVLYGYGLSDAEAIHAVRAMRAALHGFVSLEREGGFRMPVSLGGSYERLIMLLDAGFSQWPSPS